MKNRWLFTHGATIIIVTCCGPFAASSSGYPGDYNQDGWVGQTDLDIVLAHWGEGYPGSPYADCDCRPPFPWWGTTALDYVLDDWGKGTRRPICPGADPATLNMRIDSVDNSTALSGYVTQDLIVHSATDWLSCQLMVTPDSAGGIHQDPLGSSGAQSPDPFFFAYFPSVEYDTYVSNGSAGDGPLSAGGAVDLSGAPTQTFDQDALNIAWYSTSIDDLEELALARITLTDDATGTWRFLVSAYPAEGPLIYANGYLLNGTMFFAGDRNADGLVSQVDLDILLNDWGHSGEAITDPRADVNGDGFVGQGDLDTVLDYWGQGTPAMEGGPIPEPGSLPLLGIAGMFLLGRKRL